MIQMLVLVALLPLGELSVPMEISCTLLIAPCARIFVHVPTQKLEISQLIHQKSMPSWLLSLIYYYMDAMATI